MLRKRDWIFLGLALAVLIGGVIWLLAFWNAASEPEPEPSPGPISLSAALSVYPPDG